MPFHVHTINTQGTRTEVLLKFRVFGKVFMFHAFLISLPSQEEPFGSDRIYTRLRFGSDYLVFIPD